VDIKQLRMLFIEEATEVIEKLDIDIINFEENPHDAALLDELYRGVHTLKGSANAFEFTKLGEFVHHFEDTLSYFRTLYSETDKCINSTEIDSFLEAVDIIKAVMKIDMEASDELPANYNSCLEHIKSITNNNSSDDEETLIVENELIDSPDLGTEFDNEDNNDISPLATEAEIEKEVPAQKRLIKPSYIKVDTLKLDELFDSIGELVIAQNFISEAEDIKKIKNESVERSLTVLSKITRRIQNGVMSLRMVPIYDTFEKMKRVARDASKKVGKDIHLNIEGADTEIDKTMIDALSDPLIHIIRNAIDHGIEDDVDDRVKKDKNVRGQITIKAYHQAANVAIEISDDGRGINKEKVLNKAIEKGLVNKENNISENQIYELIMQAGFSTADQISDISGRGVGLDVVRNAIENLNGKVEIHSKLSSGSTFTILLPLTLAIIDGMSVRSEQDTYIIPTLSILESFIPKKQIVYTFKKEGEFVDLRGEMLPIVRLNQLLELEGSKPDIWESTLICIENDKGKFALLVDDIIGRQQVVIKSLDPLLAKVKELAGSAILGNGEVALILNTEALFLPDNKSMDS